VLDLFERDGVIAANERKAARFFAAAAPLAHHPGVRDFRHLGMIWAFEVATEDPAFAARAFALRSSAECLLRPIARRCISCRPMWSATRSSPNSSKPGLAIVEAFARR